MIKAGRSVEFRGTWRDAIEKYYIWTPKKAGYIGEISCKSGTLQEIIP